MILKMHIGEGVAARYQTLTEGGNAKPVTRRSLGWYAGTAADGVADKLTDAATSPPTCYGRGGALPL